MTDPAMRDLVSTLLEMVDQKRHDHSQAEEACRRRVNDATRQDERLGMMRHKDGHRLAAKEYDDLRLMMQCVIEEEDPGLLQGTRWAS